MKKQNGITLIALVITIIVLLILAGVSIAMLTGENGILSNATQAQKDTDRENAIESIDIALQAIKVEVAANIVENSGYTIDTDEITNLKSSAVVGETVTDTAAGYDIEAINTDDGIKITYNNPATGVNVAGSISFTTSLTQGGKITGAADVP